MDKFAQCELAMVQLTQRQMLLVFLLCFSLSFFYEHNMKIYNLTKHIYINDTIGSMIGMATLNDL